jgi:hypothetical protein
MSNQDHTRVTLPNEACSADPPLSTAAADQSIGDHEPKPAGDRAPRLRSGQALSPAGGDRGCPWLTEVAGNARNHATKPAKLPGRCHHAMERGFYCQNPALRGQRIRMARAIAKHLPYRFELPALDDLCAVQAAVEHVARALAAGLMKREEAGTLLWALQQSAINHRVLALVRMHAGAPPLSRAFGDSACPELAEGVGEGNHQKRLVEEYPEFEAEFGLPADIDVSQPAHVHFPPPEDQWRVPTPARDPKTSPWVHRQPGKHWTKEEIEREELNKKAGALGQQAYLRERGRLHERIARQVRKQQEAAWQA